MDYGCELRAACAIEDLRTANPMGDPGLYVGRCESWEGEFENRSCVINGLSEARQVGDLVSVEKRCFALQLRKIKETCWQDSAVLLPPSLGTFLHHANQGIDVRLICAPVAAREDAESVWPDA
ncbi:hypothetical protein GCM10010319_57480 [Streptomyces blastmyceticus]|uniref:Uncharacterized protein n=1 Tax=Streptomyces blastmyceticus TaxID=68180 RepID=A0ABN0XT38_9ACTN